MSILHLSSKLGASRTGKKGAADGTSAPAGGTPALPSEGVLSQRSANLLLRPLGVEMMRSFLGPPRNGLLMEGKMARQISFEFSWKANSVRMRLPV